MQPAYFSGIPRVHMTPSADCVELVKRFEGFRSTPYLCPAGRPTIGYGHTSGVTLATPEITEHEGGQMLARDLASFGHGVCSLVAVPISQGQFDALVSFAFNLGLAALQSSTLLRKLNAGELAGAADEFMRWVHANGKELPGLVRRRAAERSLFLGVWP